MYRFFLHLFFYPVELVLETNAASVPISFLSKIQSIQVKIALFSHLTFVFSWIMKGLATVLVLFKSKMYSLLCGKLLWDIQRECFWFPFFLKLVKRTCLTIAIQVGWNCSQICPRTHTLGKVGKAYPNW